MHWIPNVAYTDRKRETKVTEPKEPTQLFPKLGMPCFFQLPKKIDGATQEYVEVEVKLSDGGFIEIHVDGYGEPGIDDGCGTCVMLDHYMGRLTLYAFADITKQDPVSVDMEGAREDLR